MLFAIVAGSLLFQGTIDYETNAKRLDKILEDLSNQTGVTLVANPPMNREIVALAIHGKPLHEVMGRLANVTGSQVEQTPKGWKLVIDPRLRDAAAREAFNARLDQISRAQRALLARLDEERPFDAKALARQTQEFETRFGDDWRKPGGVDMAAHMRRAAPGNRAIRRLVARLDPVQLAKIPDEGIVVFSDQPRAMQSRLGAEARAAIQETAKEQNEWLSIYRSDGTFERKTSWLAGDPRAATETIVPDRTRLVLRAEGGSYGRLPTFTAYFAEADGTSLVTVHMSLAEDVKPPVRPPRKEVVPPEGETDIVLSEEAKAHLMGLSTLTWKLKAAPARPELRKILLKPLQHEPLGFALSEGLIETAKAKKVDLVACLPDNSLDTLGFMIDPEGKLKSLKPSNFLASLQGTVQEADARWLTVRPKGISSRCDREELARFLGEVDRSGCIRLDAYADFAVAVGKSVDSSLVRHLVDSLLPGATSTIGTRLHSEVRLYGLLPREVRQRLRKGETIRIGDLPKDALNELQTAVFFRRNQGLDLTSPRASGREGRFSSVSREPTEALPNGISPDGTLQFRAYRSPAIFADLDYNNMGQPMQLASVAAHLLVPEIPRLKMFSSFGDKKIGSLRTGHQEVIYSAWKLTPDAAWSHAYVDNEFDLRAPRGTLDNLPSDWKKELDFAVAQRRKQELEEDKQLGQNQSTGTPPPYGRR